MSAVPAALSFVTKASMPPPGVLWMRLPAVPGKPDPGVVCPGHVGVARLVHGDPVATVKAAAAQIGGIDEGRACRVELRDEGIGAAATTCFGWSCPPCRESRTPAW